MKISSVLSATALLISSASAFTVVSPSSLHTSTSVSPTQKYMFGGAGAGLPNEDNPEELEKMKTAAAQMGMSLEEYQLGISARMRLTQNLDAARVTGGDEGKVFVERDGNNPPKHLDVKITADGKALGADEVSKALCTALKKASDDSRETRSKAQKEMMEFIGEEMKKFK